MAGITVIAAANVRVGFTDRSCTVVTTDTGASYLGMVYIGRRDRSPGGREGRMATIALIRARNVGVAFATGIGTVVTTDTITRESTMVYGGR